MSIITWETASQQGVLQALKSECARKPAVDDVLEVRDGCVRTTHSNGQTFEQYSFQGTLGRDCAQSDYAFVDINGDGKTDVTCRSKALAALSTGSAFLYVEGGGWCDYYNTPPAGGEATLRSQMQPMDVDGDGLPELICTFAGSSGREVHVRRWTGTAFAAPAMLNGNFCTPGPTGASITGGDFDGDGKSELVCECGGSLTAGPRNLVPDLIVGATNELGGGSTVSYGPSSRFSSDNNPGVRQVVTSMTTHDGRGGASTSSFIYAGIPIAL